MTSRPRVNFRKHPSGWEKTQLKRKREEEQAKLKGSMDKFVKIGAPESEPEQSTLQIMDTSGSASNEHESITEDLPSVNIEVDDTHQETPPIMLSTTSIRQNTISGEASLTLDDPGTYCKLVLSVTPHKPDH